MPVFGSRRSIRILVRQSCYKLRRLFRCRKQSDPRSMHIAETTSRRFGRDTVSRSGGSLEELSEFLHQITPADRIDSNPLGEAEPSAVEWSLVSSCGFHGRPIQQFQILVQRHRKKSLNACSSRGRVRVWTSRICSLVDFDGAHQPLRCRRLLRSQP